MRKMRKWKKELPRIFAVVLAAVMLFIMPGTASVAVAETAGTDGTYEVVTEQTADEVTKKPEAEISVVQELETGDSNPDETETGDEDTEETEADEEEPAEEKPARAPGEETKECICDDLCTEYSINEDCTVCSAEDAELSCCKGVEEDDEQEDTETEEEQEQVDLSRCLELQETLDAANAPASMEEPTEGAVAKVEKNGEETKYVTSLTDAFISANSGATITLLTDVDLGDMRLTLPADTTLTLDCGGFTLSSDANNVIYISSLNAALTFKGGTIRGNGSNAAVCIDNGTFTMSGGVLDSKEGMDALQTLGNAYVTITGGIVGVNGYGLNVNGCKEIALSGGTYSSIYPGREGTYPNWTYKSASFALAEGYALKGADGFIRRDATGYQYNVTVVRCTHEGAVTPNEDGVTHGGDCPYCGTEFDAEPHTDTNGDGKCDGCKEQLAAKVETGSATTYYTTIETAWAAAKGKTATVILLADVTVSVPLMVTNSDNITFDGGEYTLTCDNDGTDTFYVVGGTLAVTGGTIKASQNGIIVTSKDAAVHLSGGTITSSGGKTVSIIGNYSKVSNFLLNYGTTTEPHYAYYQGSTPVTSGLDEQFLPAGTYTVKECKHDAAGVTQYQHNDSEQTHTMTCLACGYTETADCSYTFSGNVGTCSLCGSTIEVTVTGTENLVYNNTEKRPDVTVMLDGKVLAAENNYSVTYANNVNAGKDTASVTVSSENSDINWSYTKNFTINKADVTADDLDYTPPADLVYTGETKTADVTTDILTGIGGISVQYKKDNAGNLMAEAIEPGTYYVYAVVSGGDNYNNAQLEMGNFTIDYMSQPETILFNNATKVNYYGRNEVVISASGYTVSDTQNSGYADTFTIPVPAQTGTVKKTLYFSKDGGISDAVEISVNFDLTPPTGKVTIGTKWWKTLLQTISFGHYTAKKYTITIESNDAGGSGIAKTEYAIIEGDVQYTDADALAKASGVTWKEYGSGDKPTVPEERKCVIYARLTDGAGNVSYISTDGILLDKTPPAVNGLSIENVETRTVDFTFTVDEAADYYYVVLPESAAWPGAADIIAGGSAIAGSAKYGNGEVTEKQITGGKAAVNVTADSLTPGMTYKVYVTAVDKTVDFENGASAGNVGEVEDSAAFTMKKLDQAVPKLTYTRTTDTETGRITLSIGEVAGAEYSFDGGQIWTDTNEQDGFDASQTVTLAIRMKATDTHNPSPMQTVEVNLAKEDQEAPAGFTLKCVPNGEKDYTVTIPPTEGCEYSFDGVNWSDNNVKTGIKVGETVTGYKRYKETDNSNAGSVVSDTKTMPKFTVKPTVTTPAGASGGSGGGNGGDSESGSDGGNSENNGTGTGGVDTALTAPVIPQESDTQINLETEVTQIRTGTGSTAKPDNGTKQGNDTAQQGKDPFIKGADGKVGWDVIRAEEDKTIDGNVINVDMNGSTVVPGDIFDRLKGRDITITFDMGNGIIWSVNGKSITRDTSASLDQAGDVDFSVETGVSNVPVDIVNNITGENYSIQISLAYEGEFGFTAVLSINVGEENARCTASLYYYNESVGELEFIASDIVAEDGTVKLAFTHASDYVIAIDADGEESSEEISSDVPAETPESGSTDDSSEFPQAGQAKWFAVTGMLVVIIGIGMFFFTWKKKEHK